MAVVEGQSFQESLIFVFVNEYEHVVPVPHLHVRMHVCFSRWESVDARHQLATGMPLSGINRAILANDFVFTFYLGFPQLSVFIIFDVSGNFEPS